MPQRDGVQVTDGEQISNLSVITGATGALGQLRGSNHTTVPELTPAWCVEGLAGNSSSLLWHAVADDGSDARIDRLTTPAGTIPILTSSTDDEVNKILAEENKSTVIDRPIWSISLTKGKEVFVFAYYMGRPNGNSLADMLLNIVSGKRPPVLRYGGKDNKIVIATDPK